MRASSLVLAACLLAPFARADEPTGPLAEKLKGVTFTHYAKAPGYSEGPTWRKGEVFFCSGALLRVDAKKDVDPAYLNLLLAYEDRRFREHRGVIDRSAFLRQGRKFDDAKHGAHWRRRHADLANCAVIVARNVRRAFVSDPGEGRDDAVRRDLANGVAACVGDVNIAAAIDRYAIGIIELRSAAHAVCTAREARLTR